MNEKRCLLIKISVRGDPPFLVVHENAHALPEAPQGGSFRGQRRTYKKEQKPRKASALFVHCSFMKGLLRCLVFLDLLDQGRNNLLIVADNADVSYAEDRSALILVDRDDEVRLFHAGYVLDGA